MKNWKLVLAIAIGTFICFVISVSPSNLNAPNEEFITYQELEEMPCPVKGYGLTVFKGTKVERFEVEYDGTVPHPILRNEKMLLVRIGEPLIGSQVLGGMSGSPVYFEKDGKVKLAGAIAFGFSNPVVGKSLGGITPIHAMLNQRKIDFGTKSESLKEVENYYLELKTQNLGDPASLKRLEEVRSQMIREVFKPIQVGTHNGAPIQLLQPILSASSKPNISSKDSEKVGRPKPGDAVTMMLVDGDIKLGGTCTVTYVTQTKFLACGHSILMDGSVVAPARKAGIATSYKSPFEAYKMIGEQYESFGHIIYDGMFAIEGNLEKAPENSMIPVKMKINLNGRPLSINYEVFRHKLYSEAFIAQVGSQAVEPLWNPSKKASVISQSVIHYDKKNLKLFESSFAGPPTAFGPFLIRANPWSSIGRTARVAGSLISSEWNFNVESVEMIIRLKEGDEVLNLHSMKVLNSKDQVIDTVSPGDEIQVAVALRTNQGAKKFFIKIPVKIPRSKYIEKNNPYAEDPPILIFVESGSLYTERDEKKILSGTPENKNAFVSQILVNERNPQKLFIQVVLPPTKITEKSSATPAGDHKNSWKKVPSFNFLQPSNAVERKIIRAELGLPEPNYIMNVDGSIRINLKILKKIVEETPAKPPITPDKQ